MELIIYVVYILLLNKFITINVKWQQINYNKLDNLTTTNNNWTLTVAIRWGCNVKKSHDVNSNESWYIWSKNKYN